MTRPPERGTGPRRYGDGDRARLLITLRIIAALAVIGVAALLIVALTRRHRHQVPLRVAPGQEVRLPTRQAALLISPKAPSRRVVVYVHGAGETAETALSDPEKAGIFQLLLAHGYSIAADTAHGENWGSPVSVGDYLHLIRILRARGLTRVYVIAQSMGGLDGTELLRYFRPVAWAGIYPACNLRSMADPASSSGADSFAPQIEHVYRGSTDYALRRDSPVPIPASVKGLRMIFWASPGDTVVPKAMNTDRCAAEARRRGADVTVVTTTGNHGDPSNFQPAQLLAAFGG